MKLHFFFCYVSKKNSSAIVENVRQCHSAENDTPVDLHMVVFRAVYEMVSSNKQISVNKRNTGRKEASSWLLQRQSVVKWSLDYERQLVPMCIEGVLSITLVNNSKSRRNTHMRLWNLEHVLSLLLIVIRICLLSRFKAGIHMYPDFQTSHLRHWLKPPSQRQQFVLLLSCIAVR